MWPLELVHTDLMGPFQTTSIQGSLYVATFMDNYSSHTAAICMKFKDQLKLCFKNFKALAENQTSYKILKLWSNCGGEYIDSELEAYFRE